LRRERFYGGLEDSNTPTWGNLMDGHSNLRDAVRRNDHLHGSGDQQILQTESDASCFAGASARLAFAGKTCDRRRQADVRIAVDFGLFSFTTRRNNSRAEQALISICPRWRVTWKRACGTIFLSMHRKPLGIKRGTIKATVLIETILAAFEMDEILYELREHSSGLNAGRWDYIFSFIKKFANDPADVLPDRGKVTMATHFMSSYAKLLIKTCHRREVHAMGACPRTSRTSAMWN